MRAQGNEDPGSGVGSAFDGDSEAGIFNGRGYKLPASRLNPGKH